VKVKRVVWIPALARCKCGLCDHYITKVELTNGDYLVPTNSEFLALKKVMGLVLKHNLATDKFCFKAEPQKVNIKEVLV